MDNKAVLGLIVIVALAGVFFLFGGTELFSGGGASDEATTLPGGSGTLEGEAAETEDGGTDAPSKGPVLFGRSRAERVGQGGLIGRVMDFDTGKPIEKATVIVAGRGFGDESVGLSGTTDPSGLFRFDGVAAGDGYTLSVTDPTKRARTMPSVGVDAGREKDVGVLWMGQAGELVGVVLNAAGLPLAGAEVQVHGGGGSMMELLRNMTKIFEVLDQDAKPIARATSERTGRFAVTDLPSGPYTLVVRAAGFQLATRKVVMTQSGAAGGKVTVRLGAGAPITGIVVDDRGRAVEGARVAVLEKNKMQSVFFGRQFSYTDTGGNFRIDSPPTEGSYAVIVAAEGYPTLFTEASAGDGDLRLVLLSGTEVILRVLETKTERPVEDAHLMGMFAKTLSASGNKMSFASGVTDHRGEATLLASPGKLQMMFFNHEARGNAMFNPMMATMMGAGGILEGPKDTTIKGRSTTLVFHLKVGATVRGKVTAPGGKPVVGARVSTLGMMGLGGSTTSDGEGLYEMRNQSTPITAVLVSASGFVQERSVGGGFGGIHKPDENGQITIDVKMQAAASVAGRVVDGKGKPLAGVEVKIGGGGGLGALSMLTGGSRATITNAAGRYVLGGVGPAKQLHVMGHLQGRIDSKTADFEVTEGVVAAPDLVMHTGSRIKVRVEVDESTGRPESLLEFLARDQFSGPLEQSREDLKRFFLEPDLAAVLAQLACTQVDFVQPKTNYPPSLTRIIHGNPNHRSVASSRLRQTTGRLSG